MQDDESLLEAWARGDHRAGHQLFSRHFDAVHRFFANKVSSDQAVEDLVQRTFTRCLEALPKFEGASTFRTFLFGVAHNVLREFYRARTRSQRESELEEARAFDLGDGPLTLLVRHSEQRRLLKALRRLNLQMQVLLELFYFERLSGKELAEVLEINENTVRSRLRAARERLLGEYDALRGGGDALATSIEDLDAWADGIRQHLGRAAPPV